MIPYLQAVMSSTAVIILLVGTLVFLVFKNENDRSSKLWFFGCLLMASGMIILLIRSHLPNFIGFALNNFIMLYAMVLFRNSFWMVEEPQFRPSIIPFLFCVYHGLLIWGMTFTPYASEIGLAAAINWTLLYAWLFYDSGRLQARMNNRFFVLFRIMTFFGILAWGLRIFMTARFNIVSASDQQSLNALSLLFAHIVLIGAQFVYVIVRLTDEKNKKNLITELNSNLDLLWSEKERLLKERHTEKDALLRDIHDGFGSQLASLRILVERGRLSPDEFSRSLRELTADLHLIIDTLSTDELRLEDAVNDMRHRLRQHSNDSDIIIEWHITLDGLLDLPSRTILHILRILQEGITNSLKHSKATQIDITIEYNRHTNTLTSAVSDNGIGIHDDNRKGRGFSNMRQRAREVGGELIIQNRESRGLETKLSMPL